MTNIFKSWFQLSELSESLRYYIMIFGCYNVKRKESLKHLLTPRSPFKEWKSLIAEERPSRCFINVKHKSKEIILPGWNLLSSIHLCLLSFLLRFSLFAVVNFAENR